MSRRDHVASNVTGNVLVGKGGVVGLGDYDPALPHDSAVVDGNVVANQPASLYLGGMTVHGNVVSNGGSGPGRNVPIKDDTIIDGNLIVQGWSGPVVRRDPRRRRRERDRVQHLRHADR